MNPNDIQHNTQITFSLPRIVTAMDYHEFGTIQSVIADDLGVAGVYVTEVGFANGEYVALIHTDCESHNQMVMLLTDYYKEMKE
jgi:hypothetical protein